MRIRSDDLFHRPTAGGTHRPDILPGRCSSGSRSRGDDIGFPLRLRLLEGDGQGEVQFLCDLDQSFDLEIAVCTGALVTLPILCYEIWQFVRPALAPTERHAVLWLVPFAVLLFYAGLAFSFFLVLPAAVQFFMGFSTDTLQPMFSLSSYLSFFIAFMLPFGVVFELPLILFFLGKIGIVSSAFLKRKRRILIVLAFVFAGVISPTTDVFTQTMIAVPMIVLYEVSIYLVQYVLRK